MINPVEQIYKLARNVCYARGMADVCKDILCIDNESRLEEIKNYSLDKTISDYHPRLKEDGFVPTYLVEEEARHGYIQGKYDCQNIINNMANNGHTNEEIVAFCEAVIGIAAI